MTPGEVAAGMAEVLGRPVAARAIPREAWGHVLGAMGLFPDQAANWPGMQDGF